MVGQRVRNCACGFNYYKRKENIMINKSELIDFLKWFRQQPFEYSEFNTNRDMVKKYLSIKERT